MVGERLKKEKVKIIFTLTLTSLSSANDPKTSFIKKKKKWPIFRNENPNGPFLSNIPLLTVVRKIYWELYNCFN